MEENVQNKPHKLSYEELENVAHQLSEQNKQLYSKLQATILENTFKRLDYLFKVVGHRSAFNAEFVTTCVQEIENLMTLQEENKEETK